MRPRLALLLLIASALPARADAPLPPAETARRAIGDHPQVLAARDRLSAARAEARARAAGPHEFQASVSIVRRSIDREGDVAEFDAALTRAIRIGGKAGLDRAAAEALREAAENRAEDSRHQVARLLASLWFDWVAAESEAAVLARSEATLAAAEASLRRRVALKDAPPLDVQQAAAARAAAAAERLQADGRARAAKAELANRFPSLPLPIRPPALPSPDAGVAELDALAGRIAEVSHEIGAAEADRRRAEAEAGRARRDRLPDPSIGLRGFSERAGAERGVGVLLSVPIGGTARRAEADRAAALALAASADARTIRASVEAGAAASRAGTEAAIAAARAASDSSALARAVADKLARGQALGGVDLADRLLAERALLEAELAESQARAEAWRALTLLRIDAHSLWLED